MSERVLRALLHVGDGVELAGVVELEAHAQAALAKGVELASVVELGDVQLAADRDRLPVPIAVVQPPSTRWAEGAEPG